jgi:hypothetical protein
VRWQVFALGDFCPTICESCARLGSAFMKIGEFL